MPSGRNSGEATGGNEVIAKDVMSKNPLSVDAHATIRQAVQILRDNNLHDLPVVDKAGRPIGMITARAVLHAAVPSYMTETLLDSMRAAPDLPYVSRRLQHVEGMRVADAMDKAVATIRPDTPISTVAAMLVNLENDIHNLLVVDEGEKLVGIVSALDLLGKIGA